MKTKCIGNWLTTGILLLTLAGCSGPQPHIAPDRALRSNTQLLEQAQTAEAQGNLVVAAQAHREIAGQSDSPAREDHLLQAASILLNGHYQEPAADIINKLSGTLTPEQDIKRRLLTARLALIQNRPRHTLELLSTKDAETLAPDAAIAWHNLRADAYALVGNHLEAARERIIIEPLLHDEQMRRDAHLRTWDSLKQLSADALRTLRTAPPPDLLSGWLALAEIESTLQSQPSKRYQLINQWQAHFPNHPATEEFSAGLLGIGHLENRPQKIALLLPLSGNLSTPAQAVRDGFLAAYYGRQTPDYAPSIRIYDTHGEIETGIAVYKQAIDEGAESIVGPLNKQVAEALAIREEVTVPTILLNYITLPPAGQAIYQFGLLPEDEARQVAERAWLDGHTNAILLTPEGEWGERMQKTFELHWQQLGGTLLADRQYDPRKNDFAAPIRELLAVDHSRERHKQLKTLLERKIEFEPRRRQDVDFIYAAAFSRQARVIRPQLKFYYAGNLPIYSTSHVYNGEPDKTRDRDMDGIMFCDMPWVFTGGKGQGAEWQTLLDLWPATATPYKRLYAMGIDAFQLSSKIDYLKRFPQELHHGMTGNLYLDSNNKVHRQLLWAKFKRGNARLIDPVKPIIQPHASDAQH